MRCVAYNWQRRWFLEMRCWVMGGGVDRGNWEGGKVKEGLLGDWGAESWREQEHLEINDLQIKGFHSEEIVFHSSMLAPFLSRAHITTSGQKVRALCTALCYLLV